MPTSTDTPTLVPPSDAINLFTRESVRNVFKEMGDLELMDGESASPKADTTVQIAGHVGFVGSATGVIYLYAGIGLARAMTGKMLGMAEAEITDEVMNDAFGELTNMVVGGVKSRLCDGGWPCVLTIPSVIRGSGLRIEPVVGVSRTVLVYHAQEKQLVVLVTVKNP